MDAKRLKHVADRSKRIEEAAIATRRRVVLEARESGDSLVISVDGQVTHVAASEIVLPGEEAASDQADINATEESA